MTKDEILSMAKKSGAGVGTSGRWLMTNEELERFAALVAEKEREECAYNAGIALLGADKGLSNRVNQAIKERGQK